MNRYMYHESTIFTQPIKKIAKMNRFMALESKNRLSTQIGFHAFIAVTLYIIGFIIVLNIPS